MTEEKVEYHVQDKEMYMRRMNCLNNAVQTVTIEQAAGVFKPKHDNDVLERVNGYFNRYQDWLEQPQARIELIQPKIPQKQKETASDQPHDATEKMKRTIWGIVWGDNGDLELEEELKILGLNRFNLTKSFVNWEWASDFIDKYKKT